MDGRGGRSDPVSILLAGLHLVSVPPPDRIVMLRSGNTGRDLLEIAAGQHRTIVTVDVPGGIGILVLAFDEKPAPLPARTWRLQARSNHDKSTVQLFSVRGELQFALRQLLWGRSLSIGSVAAVDLVGSGYEVLPSAIVPEAQV